MWPRWIPGRQPRAALRAAAGRRTQGECGGRERHDGQSRPRGQRQCVGADERLTAERLPGDQEHDPAVAAGGHEGEAQPDAGVPETGDAASGEVEAGHEKGEELERVHADEARDAQVAADGAPAGQGHAWAAVGNTDAVRAEHAGYLTGGLLRRGRQHQPAEGQSDKGCQRPESQRPCLGGLAEALLP